MVIKYSDDFFDGLTEIRNFIAKDSEARANEFTQNLRIKIENITFMPYAFR